MSTQEYACAIVVIVLASSLEQAREKLARQVPVSYKIMAIEPLHHPDQAAGLDQRAQLADEAEPGWPGQAGWTDVGPTSGGVVLEEDQPWRSGGAMPGE